MTDPLPTAESADGTRIRSLRVPIRFRVSIFVSLLLLASAIGLTLATFFAARGILNEQIDSRLTVLVQHRQKLLLTYLNQQHERVALVASRTR